MGLMPFSDDKEKILEPERKTRKSPLFLIFTLIFIFLGMTLFLYGFATPNFLYSKVIGQRRNSCWERKIGLWSECNKACLQDGADWVCGTWSAGTHPEDIIIAASLQISGLLFAFFGLISLATRFTRWHKESLLGVSIFYTAAGIIPTIGSLYLVVNQTNVLENLVNDMEGEGNDIDVQNGLSFSLSIVGSVFFLVAAIISFIGWFKSGIRTNNSKSRTS